MIEEFPCVCTNPRPLALNVKNYESCRLVTICKRCLNEIVPDEDVKTRLQDRKIEVNKK